MAGAARPGKSVQPPLSAAERSVHHQGHYKASFEARASSPGGFILHFSLFSFVYNPPSGLPMVHALGYNSIVLFCGNTAQYGGNGAMPQIFEPWQFGPLGQTENPSDSRLIWRCFFRHSQPANFLNCLRGLSARSYGKQSTGQISWRSNPVNLRNLHQRLTDLQRSFQPKFTRQSTTLIVRYFLMRLRETTGGNFRDRG